MTIQLRKTMLATAVITFLVPTLLFAEVPQFELQRNPFARPAPEKLSANSAIANEQRLVELNPGLRAVLVAGSKSAVNIGGAILQVGECTDAFCLLSVEEGKARISRNDKEIVLSLYEQDNGDER